MPISRANMVRAAAYLATFLLSVFVAAQLVLKSKGPCAGDTGGLLICTPAGYSDLVVVDYFTVTAAATIITWAVWLIIGRR